MPRVRTAKPSAPETPTMPSEKTISKSDAARAAIDQGIENPTKASEFVLKRYGIEMTPQHFSTVKSQYKKATENGPAPKGKPGRKPKAAGMVTNAIANGGGDMLDDLTAVKHLVKRLGVEQVRKIVGLFE
jgi:hypothetical protein